MAIPTVFAVGAQGQTNNAGGGTATPGLPTGTATGDLLLLFMETANQPVVALTGWSNVGGGFVQQASGLVTALTIRWKIAGAGETAPAISAGTNDHIVARIVGVRGHNATTPINITATAVDNAATTSASIPGATTTVANCLVFAAFSTGTDVTSTAMASAWANASLASPAITEQCDNWHVTGNGGGFGVAAGAKAAAGAYNATTVTIATANTKALMSFAVAGGATATSANADQTAAAGTAPAPTVSAAVTADVATASGSAYDAAAAINAIGAAKVGTLAENASATSLAGNLPVGLADGDILLCIYGTSVAPASTTPPSGYTAIPGVGQVSVQGVDTLGGYYKLVTSAAGETAPTVTQATAGRMSVACIAYSSVDATTPFDVTGASNSANAATSVAVASVTPVTTNGRVIGACVADSSTSVITKPAEMTELEQTGTTGRRLSIAYDTTDATASLATGTRTWTQSATIALGAFTTVLRPAGGAPPAANADIATAAGVGLDAAAALEVTADQTTATALALDAVTGLAASAGLAAATGTGLDASAATTANADVAAGTGTSYDASVALGVTADVAVGTGTGYDVSTSAVPSTSAAAGLAAASGTALDAAASAGASAGVGAGIGSAWDPTAALSVVSDVALAAGTAWDATVTATGSTSASAGLASGIGTAYDATAAAVPATAAAADIATAVGAAFAAAIGATVLADPAVGTGSATDAAVIIPAVVGYSRAGSEQAPTVRGQLVSV